MTYPLLLLCALTTNAAPPTPEDPRLTLIKYYGGKKADPKVLAALVAQLGDDSFARRQEASRRLASFGPAAREVLKAAEKSADPEIAKRAKEALRQVEARKGELPGLLREVLRGADGGTMRYIQALPDVAVRREAVRIAGEEGMNRSMRVEVMRLYGPGSPHPVRSMAQNVLLDLSPEPLDEYLALVKHGDRQVRLGAWLVLGHKRHEDPRVAEAMLAAMNDKWVEVRYLAAQRSFLYPGERQMAVLTLALRDEECNENGVPVSCPAGMSLVSNSRSADRVIKLLQSVDKSYSTCTRVGVLRALECYFYNGTSPPNEYFLRLLSDGDQAVRAQAVSSLSYSKDKGLFALADLIRVLDEDVGTDVRRAAVQQRAAGVVREMGKAGNPAVPALVRLLGRENAVPKIDAVRALEGIGVDSIKVRAVLERLQKDNSNARLAEASLDALNHLERQKATSLKNK